MKQAQKRVDARNAWIAKYNDIEKNLESVDAAYEAMEEIEIEDGQEAHE